jgi:hypothetical protein
VGLGAGWAAFAVVALIAMDWLPLGTWAAVVAVSGAVLAAVSAALVPRVRWMGGTVDVRDIAAVAVLYSGVVAALWAAFEVFTTDRVLGLFLSFATGLLLGVGGSVVYTVWLRRRPLRSLGIGLHNLRATLGLAVVFAAAQFAVTFWGYQLPAPIDWVPLLFMALPVGLFEAVFFRGFVQGTLERSFGIAPAVVVAAALYGLYHVGYGMVGTELWFLFGLGIVYAVAYRLVGNVLVLWPLLIPVGSLFNNVQAGDITLPWASIAGFADVLAAMAVVVWLAARHQRRHPMTAVSLRKRTPELNRVMSRIIRSPLSRLVDRGVMLVTVSGRRSGRPYTLPVQYAQDGDVLWILVGASEQKTWWRNLIGGGRVEVVLRRRVRTGHGRAHTYSEQPEVVEEGLRRYVERFPGTARFLRVRDEQGFARVAARSVVVRIQLQD